MLERYERGVVSVRREVLRKEGKKRREENKLRLSLLPTSSAFLPNLYIKKMKITDNESIKYNQNKIK